MRRSACLVLVVLMFIYVEWPGAVLGGALENHAIGIKASTMACSFTGLADDASAVHHNPGGLVFNEKEVWYGEAYILSGISKVKYTEGDITEKSETNFFIPGFFLAKTYENWGFGVGYYTSFAGGGVEYDDFQNSGHDLESYLGLAPFTAAAAYKITPDLSLGASFSIYTGYMGSKSFREDSPDNYTEVETEYSGFAGYGYSVGMMYKPSEKVSVGVIFRSEFDAEIDGDSTIAGIKYDSEVNYTVPYMFSIGFGYKPNPKLTFCFSYIHIPFEDLDTYDITTNGVTESRESNYKEGKALGAGVEYILNATIKLWGGCVYGASATKETGINPVAPDSDKLQSSIGLGWHITPSMELGISAILSIGFDPVTSDIRELDHDPYMLMSGVRFSY